jgi:hypothetical protein
VTARILSLDSDEHRTAQELLPWFVNGTLSAAEAASMENHLAHCSRCQGDALEQARLRAAGADIEARGDVDRDWAMLRSRIEASRHSAAPVLANSKLRWWKGWLPFAVAVQTAVLLALTLMLVTTPHDERYRTLGTTPAAIEPNAVVVFRSDATNQQMRDALHAAGARIVGGPTVADAYLLRLTTVSPGALAQLRAQPSVLSVEALQGGATR